MILDGHYLISLHILAHSPVPHAFMYVCIYILFIYYYLIFIFFAGWLAGWPACLLACPAPLLLVLLMCSFCSVLILNYVLILYWWQIYCVNARVCVCVSLKCEYKLCVFLILQHASCLCDLKMIWCYTNSASLRLFYYYYFSDNLLIVRRNGFYLVFRIFSLKIICNAHENRSFLAVSFCVQKRRVCVFHWLFCMFLFFCSFWILKIDN